MTPAMEPTASPSSSAITTAASSRVLSEERISDPAWDPQFADLVMRHYTGGLLPVYDALARAYCVCDAWHSSVPGDTWPNRLYALAGRSAERKPPGWFERLRALLPGTLKRKLAGIPIYEVEAFTRQLDPGQWRWYSHDPATLRMADGRYRHFRGPGMGFRGLQRENFAFFDRRRLSFATELLEEEVMARDSFLDDVARGQLRQVSWIDPNFVDVSVLEAGSNDDHPADHRPRRPGPRPRGLRGPLQERGLA
jgi:phospholipase C